MLRTFEQVNVRLCEARRRARASDDRKTGVAIAYSALAFHRLPCGR